MPSVLVPVFARFLNVSVPGTAARSVAATRGLVTAGSSSLGLLGFVCVSVAVTSRTAAAGVFLPLGVFSAFASRRRGARRLGASRRLGSLRNGVSAATADETSPGIVMLRQWRTRRVPVDVATASLGPRVLVLSPQLLDFLLQRLGPHSRPAVQPQNPAADVAYRRLVDLEQREPRRRRGQRQL